jgi:hypothetical protein
MPPDDSDARTTRCSRRSLLRAGGGAAALSASSAGCIATLPPLGRRIRYGRVDAPEPGAPRYRRWLPAPSAFQDPPEPSKPNGVAWLMSFTPGGLGSHVVGERFTFPFGFFRPRIDHVGVGVTNYDRIVRYGRAYAVEADVDRAEVRETLAATGYEPAGSHRGFDLYDRQDLPRAVAAGDVGLVFVAGEAAPSDAKAVVDARTGPSRRYHETNETFDLLSGAAGAHPFTWFHELDEDDPRLASATSFAFDADGVYYVWTWVYPEEETPSKRAVQRELAEARDPDVGVDPRSAMDVDVRIDGQVVTVERRQGHERFRESNHEEPPPPQVTWGLDHDRDGATVTLRHEAGDPVPADRLSVDYAPIIHDGDEPTIGTQFADEYEVVEPGDSLTVDVSDWPSDDDLDTELRVVWETDESNPAILLEYDDR